MNKTKIIIIFLILLVTAGILIFILRDKIFKQSSSPSSSSSSDSQPKPDCSTYDCPIDTHLGRLDTLPNNCNGSTCTTLECCKPKPTCPSTITCPNNYIFNTPASYCSSETCTTEDCCTFNPFFFAPGSEPATDSDGKQYIDVRMKFAIEAPQRYIVFGSNNHGVTVYENSDFFTSDVTYQQPDWRITWQGFDAQGINLGYAIENKDHADFGTTTTSSLSRLYNTTGNSNAHAVETNPYFDIETIIDADTQDKYYQIISKQHTSSRYLSYTGLKWTTITSDGSTAPEHPTGHGTIDPIYFQHLWTHPQVRGQYIRFFSTTSPYSVY